MEVEWSFLSRLFLHFHTSTHRGHGDKYTHTHTHARAHAPMKQSTLAHKQITLKERRSPPVLTPHDKLARGPSISPHPGELAPGSRESCAVHIPLRKRGNSGSCVERTTSHPEKFTSHTTVRSAGPFSTALESTKYSRMKERSPRNTTAQLRQDRGQILDCHGGEMEEAATTSLL